MGIWSSQGDVLVAESGLPGTLKVALALATGKLSKARSLANQAPFAALSRWAMGAEISMIARCPLDGFMARSRSIGGEDPVPILARECDGAAVTVRFAPNGTLRISLHITGTWGADAAAAQEEVRAALARVNDSELGHALDLRKAAPPVLTSTATAIDAELQVDATGFATALHRLIAAELGEATK
ncbi:MAG: hypothetical protein NVS3B20_23230 [Polyangiales bacterium]